MFEQVLFEAVDAEATCLADAAADAFIREDDGGKMAGAFDGLPCGIDLGVEIGKRGTLDNNLIRQNFINFRVGINFADKWFMKRLYD